MDMMALGKSNLPSISGQTVKSHFTVFQCFLALSAQVLLSELWHFFFNF